MRSPDIETWQWWRLEYTTNSISPVTISKVSELQVLDAASNEYNKALLVYASERAISYESGPLPPQLRNFVRADNLAFAAEIDAFRSNAATADPSPKSPQKRKASSSSDLEVEYPRSPPTDRSHWSSSSASSPFDPNPPDSDVDILASERRPQRTLAPKTGSLASSDDMIPVSLHVENTRQEMQESGRGGMLMGVGDKYKLGSYVPEIWMEDEDEGYAEDSEEEEEQQPQQPRPRG